MRIAGSDHELKAPLRAAIAGIDDPEQIVEAVLLLLSDHRMISYRSDQLPVLAPAGRVLGDLALHPEATVHEIASRLGVTDSSVTRQMTHLVGANLIQRTRVGRRNRYRIPLIPLLEHRDIAGLLHAVLRAAADAGISQVDRIVAAQAANTSSPVGTTQT
jgi:DNA-binding MarR family transcriptional regulator